MSARDRAVGGVAGGVTGALVAGAVALTLSGGPVVQSASASVLVAGEAKAELLTRVADSGAAGELVCALGGASNYPERYYCTDGGTAGFLLSPDGGSALADELDDKDPGKSTAQIVVEIDAEGNVRARGTPP